MNSLPHTILIRTTFASGAVVEVAVSHKAFRTAWLDAWARAGRGCTVQALVQEVLI